jgi:hypothetical protein
MFSTIRDIEVVEFVSVSVTLLVFRTLCCAIDDDQISGGETHGIETHSVCLVLKDDDVVVNDGRGGVGGEEPVAEVGSTRPFPESLN